MLSLHTNEAEDNQEAELSSKPDMQANLNAKEEMLSKIVRPQPKKSSLSQK